MTVKEVAALFRVARITIYKLVERGKIPGYKVGWQWRIARKDINWFRT